MYADNNKKNAKRLGGVSGQSIGTGFLYLQGWDTEPY